MIVRVGRLPVGLALGILVLAGCADHEFEPPDREARVSEADSLYDASAFDTVSWESAAARLDAGNLVFATECRRCHGYLGRGDTEYGREQGLEVPSLVREEWEYGEDVDAVRRRIFTGHPTGMPTFGIAGLSAREIDAAAYYVVAGLRPEALGAPMPDTGGRR